MKSTEQYNFRQWKEKEKKKKNFCGPPVLITCTTKGCCKYNYRAAVNNSWTEIWKINKMNYNKRLIKNFSNCCEDSWMGGVTHKIILHYILLATWTVQFICRCGSVFYFLFMRIFLFLFSYFSQNHYIFTRNNKNK